MSYDNYVIVIRQWRSKLNMYYECIVPVVVKKVLYNINKGIILVIIFIIISLE